MTDKKGKATNNHRRWQKQAWVICRSPSWSGKWFCYFFDEIGTKKVSQYYSSISKILLRWKWITKLTTKYNADQVKGNATKLEHTNSGKNINVSPSFTQKFLK